MKVSTLLLRIISVGALVAGSGALAAEGEPASGKGKTSMCVGCHGIAGYRTVFPDVYHVPKLGGQHASYLVKALKDYKSGARKNPIMALLVANLTQRDIEDLAAYYSGQRGLVTKYWD